MMSLLLCLQVQVQSHFYDLSFGCTRYNVPLKGLGREVTWCEIVHDSALRDSSVNARVTRRSHLHVNLSRKSHARPFSQKNSGT